MTNNDIFKKLRVALQLRDDQIVEILELVDFRISKGEIGNFFRNADHPKYVECGDQVLRNFLNGLVIHLRGTKENPKKPKEVLANNKAQEKNFKKDHTSTVTKKTKPTREKDFNKPKKKITPVKKEDKHNPFSGIKFNNGKNKKA
ncbi:DUF1456 family protein [Myroides pelagicus]|uniref:DUF1456 family protein n=1 Tax=Myroides pelagicus TaxID=270914 RepID=A0A7K1GJV2_9FLAO|nr:DUF1456 family protein [Myroides pelagicus]MEC4113931.1 DUF1456 family protein [Myroides pelagicus]MTH29165.1 DUF1456 family protein [Myroides pelagicus]